MSDTKVVSVHGMPPDLDMGMRKIAIDASLVDIYSEALDELSAEIAAPKALLQGPASCRGAPTYPVRIRKETYDRAQTALKMTKTRLSAFLRVAVYRYLNHQ